MKFRSLRMRLVVMFGLCLLCTLGVVVGYSTYSTRRIEQFILLSESAFATKNAEELLIAKATAIGLSIEVKMEVALDTARSLANMFAGIKNPTVALDVDRDKANGILRSLTIQNEDFLGAYTVWEPNAFDGLDDLYANTVGHDASGRFISYWNRGADGEIQLEPSVNYENQETFANDVRKGEYYLLPRELKKECAIDPFSYPVQGQTVWLTSLVAPILYNGTFYGIAGVDLRVDFIQALAEQVNRQLYDGVGRVSIVSYQGIVAAVSGAPEMVGKSISDLMPADWQDDLKAIQAGQISLSRAADLLQVIVPLALGRTERPWGVIIEMPQNAILVEAQTLAQNLRIRSTQAIMQQFGVGLGAMLLAVLAIAFVSIRLARPLQTAVNAAQQVSAGRLDVNVATTLQDEVGQVLLAMQQMITYLREVAAVAEHISNQDLQVAIAPKSEHDVLNHSLGKMVTNLQRMIRANETALREIEQQNQAMQAQNWVKDGLTQLNNELAGDHPLRDMCQIATNFSARYLNAAQGVLYTYHAEPQELQLHGAYAFSAREHLSNTYRLGEGVIGQVALERTPILLTHVSAAERLIQTGTVSAPPLLTDTLPLIYNDELYGVLEVALFHALDERQQDFLEQAAKTIATKLFSAMQTERSQELLRFTEVALFEAEQARIEAQQKAQEATAANARLEEQQQRLQQQNEELQQLTTQLEEQRQHVEQQREELRQQQASLAQTQAELTRKLRA